MINAYLDTALAMEGDNLAMMWSIVEYLLLLNQKGFDWILCGDFQMAWEELDKHDWMPMVKSFPMVTKTPTCIKHMPGTYIDYFVVCQNLLPRMDDEVKVDVGTNLWPHRPASIGIRTADTPIWARILAEPRPIPNGTPIGCSRPPWQWKQVLACVSRVRDRKRLANAWDLVLEGLEQELLDQRDLTGAKRTEYEGRGRGGAPELRWTQLKWKPPRKRKQRPEELVAFEWAG